MKNLKVVTVVGTRPELIRLSCLIPKLDQFTNHVLVHTGQNSHPGLSDVFFSNFNLRKPDHYLDADNSSFSAMMADTLKGVEKVFTAEKPDAVMILGDTNSAIAAVVAERMKIPVYHMEAGNRSFDWNVPEELNRRMIDHISTFNLAYTNHARHNLLAEGIQPRFIQVTGSPIAEILSSFKDQISESQVLEELGLRPDEYLIASIHRQETVDNPERLSTLMASLNAVAAELGIRAIVSTHPRTRQRLSNSGGCDRLEFMEPFGYFDYIKLQQESRIVISDSGTVSEESSILGFPAISPRRSIERPEALESGNITLSGIEKAELSSAVEQRLQNQVKSTSVPEGYEESEFSRKVLNFVLSTAPLAKVWKGWD